MRIWLFLAAATLTAAACGAATEAPLAQAVVTLKASQHAELGTILTDDEGRTLYVFTSDEPNVSNCTGSCAGVWPPLTTDGEPQAGEGVDPAGLGTIERPDGTLQVTYHSQPLYYYGADTQPGHANGQGVGGAWFVVTLEGSGAADRQQKTDDYYRDY